MISPFYPCIKYKIPANLELDGTDHFIKVESMRLNGMNLNAGMITCFLSLTCENDQKAFYQLIKDCSRLRIKEQFYSKFYEYSC